MSKSFITQLQNKGKQFYVFTANSLRDIDEYSEKNIDGYISDFISEDEYDDYVGNER